MSENETERDFMEPMEPELDTIASSFPFFKLRRHESSFGKKSEKIARATELRKLLADTWGSAFLCFFHGRNFARNRNRKLRIRKRNDFVGLIASSEEKIRGLEFTTHKLFSCGIIN
jgi:hypothetical protein